LFVTTAFNGTTPQIVVGSITGAVNNADVLPATTLAAVAMTQNIKPAAAFQAPLANDVPVFAQVTSGGGVTTGAAYVIVKYIPDNDLNVGA
jgi:hypothetical protein